MVDETPTIEKRSVKKHFHNRKAKQKTCVPAGGAIDLPESSPVSFYSSNKRGKSVCNTGIKIQIWEMIRDLRSRVLALGGVT